MKGEIITAELIESLRDYPWRVSMIKVARSTSDKLSILNLNASLRGRLLLSLQQLDD